MPKVYVENNPLSVSVQNASLTTVDSSPATLRNGRVTIAVINTQVALAGAATPIQRVKVKALSGNTQPVYVGANGVTSANGYHLAANAEVEVVVDDLAKVYINGGVVGEGVSYLAS